MPIYDYKCSACGHELEALQKLADPALTECPACEKPALRKQVSAPSFRLSGSGWYETDFKTTNQKNLAGDSKENGGDSKSEVGSTDAAGKSGGSDKKEPSKATAKSSDKPGNSSAA